MFKDNRPGRHWYDSFLKRHSNITCKVLQQLISVKTSVIQEDLKEWFDSVKTYCDGPAVFPHVNTALRRRVYG